MMRTTAFPVSRKGDSLKRALFLCQDNHLASRFCEELFNSLVRDEGLNWQAVSRALAPQAARHCREAMSPDAVACLRALGAAPVNHRRLPLGATAFDFEMSDAVIAILGPAERETLVTAWPVFAPRTEIWTLDPAGPVLEGLRVLAESVRLKLDQMLDRMPASLRETARAGAVRASVKIAKLSQDETAYSYARQHQEIVGRIRPENPQPR